MMKYKLTVYKDHVNTPIAFSIEIRVDNEVQAIEKGKQLSGGCYFKLELI